MRRRWSYVALFSTLAMLGAACSGGSSKQGSSNSKSDTNAAASPAPSAGSSAPSADNSAANPSTPGAPAANSASPASPSAPAGTAANSTPGANKSAASNTPAAKQAAGTSNAPSGGTKANTPAAPTPGSPVPAGGAAAPAPGGKANYASDKGVSADTIRIGTINMTSATRSLGPAIAGVQEQNLDAAVKYVNRNGGVAGRKLQLVTCDDGGDIARGRACYEKLKDNVFALVPSITWLTDVIHDRLPKDKVPWLSWGWFKSEYEDPWMFPCHANGMREAAAVADWTAKVLKPATVGIMYLNVSEDIAAKDVATKQLQKYGIKVVGTVAQEWDSPDESQHVLAMRTANPDFVLSFSWPAPVAKFMHDASTQHWAPKLGYAANHLTGDPGYGPIFGEYIKDKTYTITSWGVPTGPDPENAEGGNTPEQQTFRDELIKTNGREYQGFKWRYAGYHHITQSGWVCVKILAKAASQLGADLTRDGFKQVLEKNAWDSGMGVTLHWPPGDHNANPYSYNREFIYKWVSASDGGWDVKRIRPDPVYDCAGGNIPAEAKTVCNS
ncbi:MAG TPA: ABC transporter substrate-binding protein [Acidimicrobiia bacterium]|nr:ABC transporter substrate-binding protein [Acidimicrobiia bacterium]HKN91172.1 ABC transporter substrate-binding protein [Acidimicrobiia bacterium]